MDVSTLPDKPKDPAPALTPRESLRRLWQAPVFVLGVSAVVCFWISQPFLCQGPSRLDNCVIGNARNDLNRPNSDPEEIARHLQPVIDRGVADQIAGEAHFLYGTALLRIAESKTGDLARDYWNRAREHLEEADKLGVPENDNLKLQYRLGKVGYYLQSDPEKVAERLTASLDAADDRAEGYNLLTATYLRRTPPNLEAALEANEQLRLLMVPEEVLARARLTGGDILLRMHRPKDAREVLERIGTQAAPPIPMKAHMLRACSYQDEQMWAEATTHWQAALADSRGAMPDAGVIRYNLGLCYRRLDNPLEAVRVWEECIQNNSGEESYAAALELAELHLQQGQGAKALERLEFALRTVRHPDDWDNKLLDHAQACELFERCCQSARQGSNFALALQLVRLYERIAGPGRALVLKGDIATDWAKARQEASRKLPVAAQPPEELAVRELFKQAAEAYEHAANQKTDAPEHGDYLWSAVSRFIDAGDQIKAQALLDEMFELTPRPDARLGEGWYLLGESFFKEARSNNGNRALKLKAAELAYRTCMKYDSTFAYDARYRVAQFEIEQGQIDEAVKELEQILQMLAGEETEVKQRARFTLVHLCYGAKKYKTVVQKMEEVLEHLPATAEATQARFELADSYRLLADEQDGLLNDGMTYREQGTREHYKGIRNEWRKHAAKGFENLTALVEKPEAADYLARNVNARRDVYYFAAYTLFQLGQFEKSLAAYQAMAHRYKPGEPDYWTAVAGMVSAYTGLGNEKKVREGLDAIREGVRDPKMDAETRKTMEDFIRNVELSLQRRTKP
jgi:tetratricopeptide (TPR) repeat protein